MFRLHVEQVVANIGHLWLKMAVFSKSRAINGITVKIDSNPPKMPSKICSKKILSKVILGTKGFLSCSFVEQSSEKYDTLNFTRVRTTGRPSVI